MGVKLDDEGDGGGVVKRDHSSTTANFYYFFITIILKKGGKCASQIVFRMNRNSSSIRLRFHFKQQQKNSQCELRSGLRVRLGQNFNSPGVVVTWGSTCLSLVASKPSTASSVFSRAMSAEY